MVQLVRVEPVLSNLWYGTTELHQSHPAVQPIWRGSMWGPWPPHHKLHGSWLWWVRRGEVVHHNQYWWYIWYMITIFSADLKLLTGIFVLAIMQHPSSGTAAWLVEAYNHNTVILPNKTFSPTNYVITTTGVITRGGRRNMNPHLRKDMCAPPKISPETQPCYLNDINKP